MKNIIFTIIIALFFVGCSRSSLTLTSQNELQLNYDDKTFLVSQNIVSDGYLNFKDLIVSQYKVTNDDGSVLFFEDAETDLLYEFNFLELSTVMYIFDDSKKYEKVYVRNNLSLVQIMMKNKSYVNVLIQANSSQIYSYIYGFSNEEFLKIANMIKLEDTKIEPLKFQGVVFDKSSKPHTNWNDLLVFFTPLITQFKGAGSR